MVKRVASQKHNPIAVQWLHEQIHLKKPFIWVGYGLSYALGQAFAEIFQQMGILSFALTPNELTGLNINAAVGYISRSGKRLIDNIDFLITQEGNDISWTNAPCLSIFDVDKGNAPWLALDYTEKTLFSFAQAINLGYSQRNYSDSFMFINHFEVLVFDKHTRPIQSLIQACNDKLNSCSMIVIDRNEIGHGFHFKLWSKPNKYTIHLCLSPSDEQEWQQIQTWAEMVQVQINKIFLDESTNSQYQIIEKFYMAINTVKLWSQQHNHRLGQKPLPNQLDQLR